MFSILKGWNLWHLLKTRTARAAMAAERAVFTADRAIITPSPGFKESRPFLIYSAGEK
jgi:hypothetical protein